MMKVQFFLLARKWGEWPHWKITSLKRFRKTMVYSNIPSPALAGERGPKSFVYQGHQMFGATP